MKLNKKYLQTFIFILVYLYAIYFWSQPLQERKLPYGEYDAMSHFEVADYIAYHDKSFMKLPPYIDLRYGNDNQFRPHTLWYPPAFHSSLAAAEAIGGERVVPVFLMNAILSTFIIITVYFVISSLFGFLPAILSAILLIFSPRDFMPHLWGQWPERFAYALIPIILYCFYKYLASFQQEKKDQKYIYFAALFLGIDILVHPLAFFHSAAGLLVLYIFMAIKHRKAFFNLKHLAIAALIFIVLFMMFPYQTLDIFSTFKSKPNSQAPAMDFSRMFKWSLNPADYSGSVPSNYFSFGEMHGLWTMPFLLLGILFLALRREDKDMLLLAWLVSLYLVLHRDFVGKATFLHRSLSATAHIFAPLTAIGAVSIASFVRLPANYKIYLKYGIAALFAALAIYFNFAYASRVLNKDTYNDFLGTLNQQEFDAGNWILKNAPEQYTVSVLGIPHQDNLIGGTAKKIRWLAAVSQHVSRFYYLYPANETQNHLKNDYFLVDYTMALAMSDAETSSKLQAFEKNELSGHTLLYDKGNIKVYKLEP